MDNNILMNPRVNLDMSCSNCKHNKVCHLKKTFQKYSEQFENEVQKANEEMMAEFDTDSYIILFNIRCIHFLPM